MPQRDQEIALLRREAPECLIAVGGAVLTAELARSIGADFYAHDAMDAVRFAQAHA